MSEITWDKYSLKINGKRIFLLGGEFHYWRCPDRERWKDILKMYKIAGLNSVRIYFHWGYHNPSEEKFIFSENRDVEYLLKLCEELGLYVLIAAGPYICAETNAGGYPGWLLAKRDVYIKHLKRTLRTKYDPKYMEYCKKWYEEFIPHIISHQITENPKGCIIAFQIENEYYEKFYITKGERRYIEELIEYAKNLGITVPTFHNDDKEANSWNGLVDLYGFDKYIIHAPKFPKQLPIPDWKLKKFTKKVDHLEKKIRSFGGAAEKSPIFIPELQGGWFNHWGIKYGYDELYDYYGDTYQKMLEQCITAQGSTMMSLYMFYGGTSWGSIPDPDVYTSYDYSACIREFGYLSNRLRQLRLFNLFIQSFKESITSTDFVDKANIKCSERDIFYKQRTSIDGTNFYFFRNFNDKGKRFFKVYLNNEIEMPLHVQLNLSFKDSFIAIGNHQLGDFFILYCSLPIIFKGKYLGGELLVVYPNGGELILKGYDFTINEKPSGIRQENFTRFQIQKAGFYCIKNSKGKKLYIICLNRETILTLNAHFLEKETQIAWGAYSIFFTNENEIELETIGDQRVYLLSSKSTNKFERFEDFILDLKKTTLGEKVDLPDLKFCKWYKHQTNWGDNTDPEIWSKILIDKQQDPIDHHFTSGHILYKCEFVPSKLQTLKLKLNIRNKAAIWLNGEFIGGHETYSIKILHAGAKNGPDPTFLGSKKYNLTNSLKSGKNILFVLTENLGHSRQPYMIGDIRNPRGIISAKFSRKNKEEQWYIGGIDVTSIDQPYNTSGLLGEKFGLQNGQGNEWREISHPPNITPNNQIVWYKTSFDWKIDENLRIPLRLHVEGKHNLYIFLNGLYIGKYWGTYGPQHDFYIMDKILKKQNILVLACWTTEKDKLKLSIKPYKIKRDSGNIDEEGIVFATQKHTIKLN